MSVEKTVGEWFASVCVVAAVAVVVYWAVGSATKITYDPDAGPSSVPRFWRCSTIAMRYGPPHLETNDDGGFAIDSLSVQAKIDGGLDVTLIGTCEEP